MSADIVTVGFCPQYYSTFSVKGSGGSVYTVSLAGTGFAHCDCPAYTYFKGEPSDRTCKHIKAVWEHGCFYNPSGRTTPVPMTCPRSGRQSRTSTPATPTERSVPGAAKN